MARPLMYHPRPRKRKPRTPRALPVHVPYEAMFPDCCLPDCTAADALKPPHPNQWTTADQDAYWHGTVPEGQTHQHILAKQRTILDSTATLLYCQGGVGSAKSVAFAVKAVHLSLSIPGNVGIVCRKDYKLLYKSCWRDLKQVLQRIVAKGLLHPDMSPEEQEHYARTVMYADKRQGDYTTVSLPNGSVIYAMQGKAWEEGLGASYGWFWVDDAMESSEEMFVGNDVSAGLLSRLRLPEVAYHKELTLEGKPTVVSRLCGMVSSNPPPQGHWLHKLFGASPGRHKLGNYTVDWIQTSTVDNPFVGADYAIGLIAAGKQMGKGQNVARRVIYGESVPAYGGIKVFPQFDHTRHVGLVKYDQNTPVIAGWDFGFHHPAVVFAHLHKCPTGGTHFWALSEVAEAFSVTVYQLWTDFVQPHIALRGYDQGLLLHAGDKAGWRASSSNRDRRGDMKILKDEYGLPFRHREILLANSLQYMRSLLDPRRLCACGQEFIKIDTIGCPVLIGALEGGYKYSKSRDGKVSDKPVEDRYFADVACAWRYAAENYIKLGIPWDMQKEGLQHPEEPLPYFSAFGQTTPPWKWMEMSDAEMARLIR